MPPFPLAESASTLRSVQGYVLENPGVTHVWSHLLRVRGPAARVLEALGACGAEAPSAAALRGYGAAAPPVMLFIGISSTGAAKLGLPTDALSLPYREGLRWRAASSLRWGATDWEDAWDDGADILLLCASNTLELVAEASEAIIAWFDGLASVRVECGECLPHFRGGRQRGQTTEGRILVPDPWSAEPGSFGSYLAYLKIEQRDGGEPRAFGQPASVTGEGASAAHCVERRELFYTEGDQQGLMLHSIQAGLRFQFEDVVQDWAASVRGERAIRGGEYFFFPSLATLRAWQD